MNKKIIALLSMAGIVTALTGCSSMKIENYKDNIYEFKQHIAEYAKLNTEKANKAVFNKYKMTVAAPIDATLVNVESEQTTENNKENTIDETNKEVDQDINLNNKTDVDNDNLNKNLSLSENRDIVNSNLSTLELKDKKLEVEKISTLYSLTDDINGECEDFANLKTDISNAIIETQNLINKINSKEIELTPEQRMLITEQSKQLKGLGRQLSHITTELSINLSDLANLMREKGDLDDINLKYLVVLDNLINGNEMLENGLHSLSLINNMMNLSHSIPPNNGGRILYGYKRNNEPPVIRDYLIDENGKISENKNNLNNEATNTDNEKTTQDTNLKANIDTYRSNRSNIDSFFNTALLDNEFMYGNNGYGYGYGPNGMGMNYGGGFNPYVENQYANNRENVANDINTNGVDNVNNTQNVENNSNAAQPKKKGLKKNVDTYKDENTPNLVARFNKIKQNFSKFFAKLSKPKNKLKQPVYKYDEKTNENI